MNIKINSCGKVHCSPAWRWDTGNFKDYDLWTIFGGSGKLLDYGSGVEYGLSAGDCFILKKGEKYLGTTDREDPLLVIYAHFDFKGKSGIDIPKLHRKISNVAFFEALLDRVVLRFAEGFMEEAETWFRAALSEIEENDKNSSSEGRNCSRLKETIEQLKSEILEYPEREYSLKKISSGSGFCRDYFSKAFKAVSGISFIDFLIGSRMEKAKYFLQNTTLKINEIAHLSGYKDIYLFSKQFKHKTGIAPSLYRDGIK